MKTRTLVRAAAALLCAALFRVPCAAEENADCRAFASEILRFSRAAGINRISVLEFAPKGGAEQNEADYIAEIISVHLAGAKKPALIERSQLAKVFKEARLGPGGWDGAGLEGAFSVDAVVAGTVFASGEKLKVMIRLIDAKTGTVLKAGLAEEERDWPRLPEAPFPGPQWDNVWPIPGAGFRDALADNPPASCEARKRRLEERNSELVDAKARYWAGRLKEPGFSIRDLTRNPGTEISDPATKARFYELLTGYHRADSAAPPGPDELARLMDLMDEENLVYNECGRR